MEEKFERLKRAWSKFHDELQIDYDLVNSTVADSWSRCLNYDLDFDVIKKSPYLEGDALEERLDKNSKLIKTAIPFMNELFNFVKGTNFLIALTDREGYILETCSDQEFLSTAERLQFIKGANWSEESKGTNAMGVVLVTHKPIQIYAAEHYHRQLHEVTCSAAPIFAPDGKLIGTLDITGDYREVHSHTLGMVVAATTAIEKQLSLERQSEKLALSYENINTIIESMSQGVLSVDNNGIITHMNSVASEMLGTDFNDYKGQPLENIFKDPSLLLEVLESGQGFSDKEIVLDTHKLGLRRFNISVRPLTHENDEIEGIIIIIRKIENVHQLVTDVVGARAKFTFDDIVTQSENMLKTIKVASRAARTNSTILLQGQSGTGKEMFAQAIHNYSYRREKPFVAINLAAIPRDLIESELFGYEAGAFTGAKSSGKAGKFELADKGTILLDEIGDMPLETQVNLLRVLEEREVMRIGGKKSIPVDIRVVAATNKDLQQEVEKGNFRSDLFYRLNVINIKIPELQERDGDIEYLTKYFLPKLSRKLGIAPKEISQRALEYLTNYTWPGNVRELENVLERVITVTDDEIILPKHLPNFIKKYNSHDNKELDEDIESNLLEKVEKKTIIETLRRFEGNISRAADILGIARNTLYRKINKYGIEI